MYGTRSAFLMWSISLRSGWPSSSWLGNKHQHQYGAVLRFLWASQQTVKCAEQKWKRWATAQKQDRWCINTSGKSLGPSSSGRRSSGRSWCAGADYAGGRTSDDGRYQTDLPSNPQVLKGDPASWAPRAQRSARSSGAAGGSGPDLLVASGSTQTLIFVWAEQPQDLASAVLNLVPVVLSSETRPRRC